MKKREIVLEVIPLILMLFLIGIGFGFIYLSINVTINLKSIFPLLTMLPMGLFLIGYHVVMSSKFYRVICNRHRALQFGQKIVCTVTDKKVSSLGRHSPFWRLSAKGILANEEHTFSDRFLTPGCVEKLEIGSAVNVTVIEDTPECFKYLFESN